VRETSIGGKVATFARAIAILIVATLAAPSLQAQQWGDYLHVLRLDVDQGEATLIITPTGRRILIDAGPNTWTAGFLRLIRADTIDLVIATHAHADHIGGMQDVFESTVVRAYVDNGLPHNTRTYLRTLRAVENEPGLQYLAASDRTIRVGDVSLRILPPPRLDATQNNNSVGVLLEFGTFRALFTGDAEIRELGAWLRSARIPEVTLINASHHGASNGATRAWIRATSPEVVVVSAGRRNSYGHPSPAIVSAWTAAKARVYRTDMHGTIFVRVARDGTYRVTALSEAAAKPR
jgi:competence protein ComEC